MARTLAEMIESLKPGIDSEGYYEAVKLWPGDEVNKQELEKQGFRLIVRNNARYIVKVREEVNNG